MSLHAAAAVNDPAQPLEHVEDELTFESFFEREAVTLFRRMCLVTGDRHEAEEVVQDAFVALLERWDRVSRLEDPVGYLYRSAFNHWKKRSRRAARRVRELAGVAPSTDEFGGVEDRTRIDQALARLTPRQRAAVVLTEMIGYTSAEAGRILGVRDVTVRALASQGRATMRDVLGGRDV
jgi:RNA polymerase sigma factor (sigma-70 family)